MTATRPSRYATAPQATKVPAEKKEMNSDNPHAAQGRFPSAETNMRTPPLRPEISSAAARMMTETSRKAISSVMKEWRFFTKVAFSEIGDIFLIT